MNEKTDGTLLDRRMVNFPLAEKVTSMIAETVNVGPHPVGCGLSTMCLCIANTIAATNSTPVERSQVLADVFRFIAELMTQAKQLPTDSERRAMN